jgi:hypothetical protein
MVQTREKRGPSGIGGGSRHGRGNGRESLIIMEKKVPPAA